MQLYQLFLAGHIISFVAWFSGLFYLPRIFVYLAEQPQATPTLTIMANKLMKLIMRPAAAATLFFGIAMIVMMPEVMQLNWLHAKLFFVLLLMAYHGTLEGFLQKFNRGANRKSGRFFRFYNEVPTILLIVIVLLAITKPF